MATYIHTSIIVTGPTERVERARNFALGLDLQVTGLTLGRNGFDSFLVGPSGSAGAPHPSAARHSEAIAALVDYLRPIVSLDWVAVTYGRENGPAQILTCGGAAQSQAAVRWSRSRSALAAAAPREADMDGRGAVSLYPAHTNPEGNTPT